MPPWDPWDTETKSPDDKKILAMAAEINALKGQLKLSVMLRTRKRMTRVRTRAGRRIKRTLPTRNIRKRMRHGRKCLPRIAIRKKSNWANIPSNGANTTWRGRSTSLMIAA
jgi:hypothetical protein